MPAASRNLQLGALRTFITLLVVAHHAALAYVSFAPPPPRSLAAAPMFWLAYPVADSHRSPGLDLLVGWNDTFFMSLMFLVSGVFAWPSLVRKGAARFFRDRALRLGLPFVASALLLAPLAYYPAYLQSAQGAAAPRPGSFLSVWARLGVWPAGPAWFLWVLLAFGGLAAAAFKLWPGWGAALGRLTDRPSRHPSVWCGALIAVSALAYLPMASFFRPEAWSHLGPCWVQTSRLLHYAVYFCAGAGLGASSAGRQQPAAPAPLAADGKLARRWPLWVLSALAAFALAVAALLAILQSLAHGGPGPLLAGFGNLTFVLSCACSSFACLAVFARFARRPHRATDSLGANAYGIYLLHYLCVSWLQLALLRTDLPGAVKWSLVFTGAVALSWSLSAALRRIPGIGPIALTRFGAELPPAGSEPAVS